MWYVSVSLLCVEKQNWKNTKLNIKTYLKMLKSIKKTNVDY